MWRFVCGCADAQPKLNASVSSRNVFLHEIKFAPELIGVVPCAAVRATLQWYFQPATFLR
jgi:hypothetical protein